MRIYNYLFYKSYLVTKWSKNFEDTPVFGGIWFVIGCVMFNVFAVSLFLAGLGIDPGFEAIFSKEYKVLGSIAFVALVYFYYSYKGRWKRIIEYYEKKEEGRKFKLHPVIVIILYYGTSTFLIFLAGFFKNKDWIFAQ